MVENLSDAEILQALKRYDERVTREFFYDTCHIAYCIDDKKYGLRYKTGMDFYSLAHEYYLRLCNNNWVQLEKRTPHITLANWTMNGFHYLVRERLNTYSHQVIEESIEERASQGKMVFDAPVDNHQEEVKEMIEDICHSYYGSDRKAQSILRMILIMGMKGKEVASLIGITPAAVSQRYHAMMDQVVRPYFIRYYDSSSRSYAEAPSVQYDIQPSARASEDISPSAIPPTGGRNGQISDSLWRRFTKHFHHKDEDRDASVDDTWDVGHPRRRITPPVIKTLNGHEVFVFGSDLRGVHCGGTAYQALRSFGAKLGQGVGPQGQCYAIPTIVGGLRNIQPFVDDFRDYVTTHPHQTFLVTPIGCGIAGFTPDEIAPLFAWATQVENICLPQEFWEILF